VRLHGDVSVEMVQCAVSLLAAVPSTLVHTFDFFVSTAGALVLLGTRDRDEGVDLRERMLLTISCSYNVRNNRVLEKSARDFSTCPTELERLLVAHERGPKEQEPPQHMLDHDHEMGQLHCLEELPGTVDAYEQNRMSVTEPWQGSVVAHSRLLHSSWALLLQILLRNLGYVLDRDERQLELQKLGFVRR
jgi:hypothetical protein